MKKRAALLFCLVAFASRPAEGQVSYEVLHAFSESPITPSGRLVEATNGLLYGTAASGGEFEAGAVFSVARSASNRLTLSVLHAFNRSDGANPNAGLIQATDGNFYGTTPLGGQHGFGTVFKMTPEGRLTTLHAFDGTDGQWPIGTLVQGGDGYFYGTSSAARDSQVTRSTGTVFKISSDGEFILLHRFNIADGGEPRGALVVGPEGHFYGTTSSGGAEGHGTIFKITPQGTLATLYSFPSTGPYFPADDLVLAGDGNFYGSAIREGSGDQTLPGAIFRMTPDGALTFIHTMQGTGSAVSLIQADSGNLYGVSSPFPGGDSGTVFTMTLDGAFTTIFTFPRWSPSNSFDPVSIMQARDRRLYVTSTGGGIGNRGGVVGMTVAGAQTAAGQFINDSPLYLFGRVLQGPDGNFYSTSCSGGTFNQGTIFKMTPTGAVTVLHSFVGAEGSCPAGLLFAKDGNWYGTTTSGGQFQRGTVFKLTPSGAFSTLHPFTVDEGSSAVAALVQGNDGAFYGTAYKGGASRLGTTFKITPAGAFTTLHSFTGLNEEGANPIGGVIQACDGHFYGTTFAGGGVNNIGTIFRMTGNGAVTTLHSFSLARDGVQPAGDLLQSADGTLYGTTVNGSVAGSTGTIFKITTGGLLTNLHEFTPSEGAQPYAGLIRASDSSFYGTTFGSNDGFQGDSGFGSLFSMTASGNVILLHTFSKADGARPFARLTQGSDGAFYGTTSIGGPGNRGVVFRIRVTGVPAPGVSQPTCAPTP
jgi:uncharacterized repeat protein (TIGR03803 family)